MSDEREDGPEAGDEAPKRKKRRRAASEAPAAEAETAGEARGASEAGAARKAAVRSDEDEGVPAFARDFPRDDALDALVAAFEAGDYARVRREAPALARATTRPEVRRAARELRRRLDPDPIAIYLLAAASLLLVFLALWYWSHGHEVP